MNLEGEPFSLSASTIFSSSTRCTPEDDSVLALDMRVLTTATLCVTGWCDAKERYWLVCVVFQYTFTQLNNSTSFTSMKGRHLNT